jgi:hypothetical protein
MTLRTLGDDVAFVQDLPQALWPPAQIEIGLGPGHQMRHKSGEFEITHYQQSTQYLSGFRRILETFQVM